LDLRKKRKTEKKLKIRKERNKKQTSSFRILKTKKNENIGGEKNS
jgi:hypothetical protein